MFGIKKINRLKQKLEDKELEIKSLNEELRYQQGYRTVFTLKDASPKECKQFLDCLKSGDTPFVTNKQFDVQNIYFYTNVEVKSK